MEIISSYIWSIVISLISLFLLFLYLKKIQKYKEVTIALICLYLLAPVFITVLFIFFEKPLTDSFTINSNVYSLNLLTLAVSIASLSLTLYIFYKNKMQQKEDSNIKFAQELIKNNYTMLVDANFFSDINILKQLKLEFVGGKYFIDSIIKSKLLENKLIDDNLKEKLKETYFELKDKKNEDDYHEKKHYNENIKEIINGGQQANRKWLIWYFENKDETTNKTINSTLKEKRFYSFDEKNKKILEKYSTYNKELIKEIQDMYTKHIREVLKDETIPKNANFVDTKRIVNTEFSQNYQELGSFLRNSYRVVKFINANIIDTDKKNELLGIQRSYYPESVLLLILYNSIFTDFGLGYGRELISSDFFGDEKDFENSKLKTPHIRNEEFILKKRGSESFELQVIQQVFLKGKFDISDCQDKHEIESKLIEKINAIFDTYYFDTSE